MDAILKEAHELISGEKHFRFWELLLKSETRINGLGREILGDIDERAVISGKVFLGRGALIKPGSLVEGNVYIGEGSVIGPNAFLRHGTVIAPGCHIGSSEIKNSIILQGSKVPHFSYAGDSVIGMDCNLGAGTKIANLRHDGENVKVKIGGRLVDSGRRKLGALLFNDVKTGINSSINCGAILLKGIRTRPNEFVK